MTECNCCGQKDCKCNYPDPRILILEAERDRYKETLENIRDISFDGDGLSALELGKDIAKMAQSALVPQNTKKENS